MANRSDQPVSSYGGKNRGAYRRNLAAGVAALSSAIPCRSSAVLDLLVTGKLVALSDVIYIQATIITDYPDVRP